MSHLFDSFVIRDIEFANRVFISPMCQYSSGDGLAEDLTKRTSAWTPETLLSEA